jgi:2-dehydro-3-deoxyphosphogluconate aldolase/(4S)-4-hydroxy-2-oxoglutarate aldolase
MTNRKWVSDTVSASGLIAIVRSKSPEFCFEAVSAVGSGGCNVVEATLTTPGALELITRVREELPHITMGIGSVLSVDHVRAAVHAGAQFVVTPILSTDVIKACNDADLPIVCGAYTPTEAQTAHEAGADFVKLFPADTLGAKYIKALLAPLPHLRIIPTGGVDLTTIPELFKAGCVAVAAGSNLVSESLLTSRDAIAIRERTRLFVDVIAQARTV